MKYSLALALATILLSSCGGYDRTSFRSQFDPNIEPALEAIETMGLRSFSDIPDGPELKISDRAGSSLSLADYEGRFVFLNFWATWCEPCRWEMPSMERLNTALEGRPFEMVVVNIGEEWQLVDDFVMETDLGLPMLMDDQSQSTQNYGAVVLPTTYILDPSGRVLGGLRGSIEWDEPHILEAMDTLIKLGEEAL